MAEPQELTAEQQLALEMFEGNVPCILYLSDAACEKQASWILFYAHEEAGNTCRDTPPPAPVCDEHRRVLSTAYSVFFRMWTGMEPTRCDTCASPIRISRAEPLKGTK